MDDFTGTNQAGPAGRLFDPSPDPGPRCPHSVERASMIMRWDNLTFLHWPFDPAAVQRLLPPGLTVDTFDGSAWVGLVPFEMEVRLPHLPAVPWLSHFPETNVRTYARAADGTTGVWFLSLDAARSSAVATARTSYHLPYFWSKMQVTTVGPVVSYRSRRRWPGPVGARCEVVVEVGPWFDQADLGPLDHWLTARWRLYSSSARGLRAAEAEHEPWPLHAARVLHGESDLLEAAGLPPSTGEPVVHWSPGVEVRIGLPHRLGALDA